MDENSRVRYTTIINKYPTYRDEPMKSPFRWLEGRAEDDNAEGYWRIHDKLYDLNEFIEKHPGGKEWLTFTKGMDITEPFESYHVLPKAPQVLKQFYVKDADQPRNYRITFKDDGFYRTLKRRVAEKLPLLDTSDLWKPKVFLDLVLFMFLTSMVMTIRSNSITSKYLYFIAGAICASWGNAAVHNFTHKRDNWRMYTANIFMFGYRGWRIFHALSHHMYPNTYTDYEIYAFEPNLTWMPSLIKSRYHIIQNYISSPFAYTLMFHSNLYHRFRGLYYAKTQKFEYDELLVFLPPVLMFIFGDPTVSVLNIYRILLYWNAIILTGSFVYAVIAINAGHHGYEIVHEGDEFKDLDFGVYQMAATVDRIESNDNIVLALTLFGNHTLHHLFPSLDHALLPQLRDILTQTCKEFDVDFRKWTLLYAAIEQYKQLGRQDATTLKKFMAM